MCLILLAWKADSHRDLVIAANRDEYYDRPTAPARFWKEKVDILGSQDLRSGGTQLAVSRKNGRFAAVTNIRNANAPEKLNAPSRGLLVTRFLENDNIDPATFLNELSSTADQYNGFNLVVADLNTCWHFSSVTSTPRQLEPGTIYGLCNHHTIDPSWPKVAKGKAAMQSYLEDNVTDRAKLFQILSNRTIEPDSDLPKDTGYNLEIERALSPFFVQIDTTYGTRSSTVIERRTVKKGGGLPTETTIDFCEQTFSKTGETDSTHEYIFVVGS